MIDPTSAALRALAARNGWAPAIAFAAGALGSLGPCVAPRMLAIAALTVDKPPNRGAGVVAVFAAGIIAAYSALALGGTLLWQALRYSAYAYAVVATIMAAAGIAALVRKPGCGRAPDALPAGSMSSVFLLGATSVATFSPCCTPLIAAAVVYAQGTGLTLAWLTLVGFALGHMVPLVFAAAGSRAAKLTAFSTSDAQIAAGVVSGALLLGGASFYYVLA